MKQKHMAEKCFKTSIESVPHRILTVEMLAFRTIKFASNRILPNTFCRSITKTSSPFEVQQNEDSPSNSWGSAEAILKRVDWDNLLGTEEALKRTVENCARREVKVDVHKVKDLYEKVQIEGNTSEHCLLELLTEVKKLPNKTHKHSWAVPDKDPSVVRIVGNKPENEHLMEFHKFCKGKNILRLENLGGLSGHRANALMGPLAELQTGIVRYAVEAVKKHGFTMVSVPDILFPEIIEGCGMATSGDHHQVYFLDEADARCPKRNYCLSGTAEMALGGLIHNRTFQQSQLPLKLAAVSRCYRAEAMSNNEEHGLYRVHYFTKVEMFGVTAQETGSESNDLHLEILEIEENLYKDLGLHFRVLEMPPYELGLSAHRKFDIEAWMPGKKIFGEISSCSNCTDFQSRRLNARYKANNGSLKFVHTVNGTACAAPRMLISLVETFQNSDGLVTLPPVLSKFMHRSWQESHRNNSRIDSYFLRSKSQMDAITSKYE